MSMAVFGMLLAIPWLCAFVGADIAPGITWIHEGYNFVAKLPCRTCPYLYEDTSKGEHGPWTQRKDSNALLLNISLPYDSSSISVNQATIWPRTSKPPHVYANQVLLDISPADLQNIIASGQLDISHETGHGGGGFFGVSYHHSLHHVHGYPALVFRFDVVDIYSNQPDPPFTQDLNDSDQEIVEMVLLQKPLMSALEPVSFEIIKAELVPRSKNLVRQSAEVMHFRDWDAFGQKGIMSHLYTSLCSSSLDSLANSTFGIFFFVLGVVILFLIVCIVCLFGCNPCADEYEQAQHGKSSGKKKRRHHSGDVETGGLRFKSAEELGLLGKGRVVGIGKSD